jgi:outer membrane protein
MPFVQTPMPAGSPTPTLVESFSGLDLSVEEALLGALQGNPDLAVQRYEPVITGAFQYIEAGVFDPRVFAELAYGRENSIETARATGEQFPVRAWDTLARTGARKRFASGTDVEVSLEHEADASNRAPDQQRARVGLSVTQNLLRGRGAAVNLARVRQARLATIASQYELRGFVSTLLADTKVAYWQHVLARRRIEIFEQSLALSKRQLGEIEQSIEVGALAATEVAPARSEVALREQGLINARAELEAARLRLLRLLGYPNPAVALNTTTDPEASPTPVGALSDRVTLALRSRPELNEARMRQRERRLETIITRDGLRPRLDFFVSLGRTGYSGSLIDSFGGLRDNTYDLVAGLTFEATPRNQEARGRDIRARASSAQALAAITNLENTIRYDVYLSANEVNRARLQIGASKTTREAQESTVEAERERFKAGSSTALLVAQAQRDLLVSQIAEVEAVIAYRIALVRLYLSEGTMIERHGISIP